MADDAKHKKERAQVPMSRAKTTTEIVSVPIDEIELGEGYRKNLSVAPLMDSIKEQGLLQPVGLRKNDDNKKQYTRIFGLRRITACKELGWKAIPAAATLAPVRPSP